MGTVLLTDRAWPDDGVERGIIEAAGHRLVSGPAVAGDAASIEALAHAHQPDAIMTCWAPVSSAALAAAPALRIVARMGVGLDNIAVDEAARRGIWVTNVPDYCVEEVSDHALALILAWARGVAHYDAEVKRGVWAPAGATLRRVRTLAVGIIGYGRIGRATARKVAAFGCTLRAHDPSSAGDGTATMVGLDDLLAESDVVILHLPLTPTTEHFVDRAFLARMKPGAFLVNVSRGGLVDASALIAALDTGRLSGAGLDVVEGEPAPPPDLVGRADVIATPHVAFSSTTSVVELRRRAAEEVVRVLGGARPAFAANAPSLLA